MGRVARPRKDLDDPVEEAPTRPVPPLSRKRTTEEIQEGAMILWGVYHILSHGKEICLYGLEWKEARPIVAEMMARKEP